MMDEISPREQKNVGIPVAIVLAGLIVAAALYFRSDGQVGLNPVAQTGPLGEAPAVSALPLPGVDGRVAGEQAVEVPIDDNDPRLGETQAPVTMIEFTDFECPFCKKYHDETFSQIKVKYIDTGKVQYVVKHFPLLQIHKRAQAAGIAAQCAQAQGKFFEYVDQLFAHQDALQDQDFTTYARAVGLSEGTFQRCYAAADTKSIIDADQQAGIAAGVTGTPGFFINGHQLDGAHPFEQFEALIEAELKN